MSLNMDLKKRKKQSKNDQYCSEKTSNEKTDKQKKIGKKELKRLLECNLSPIRVAQPPELPLTPRYIGPASPLNHRDNVFFPDSHIAMGRPPTPRTPEHLKTDDYYRNTDFK